MIDREALAAAKKAADKAFFDVVLVKATAQEGVHNAVEAAITAYFSHAGEGAVPVGWQLAPEKVTAEQIAAAWHVMRRHNMPRIGSGPAFTEAYNAMLAAAPHPPRQDGAHTISMSFAAYEEAIAEAEARGRAGPKGTGEPPAPDEAATMATCTHCGGNGERVPGSECPDCHGRGYL